MHDEPGRHLLLYDGSCGLCHGVVLAVLERDPTGVFRFASLQSSVAARRVTEVGAHLQNVSTFVVIPDYLFRASTPLTRAGAGLFVLKTLGWSRTAALLDSLPTAFLDRVYDLIARHRHRFFGRRDHCPVPRPDDRHRFLDLQDIA